MWNKIGEALRHNLGLSTAIILALLIGLWFSGCDSKVQSPFTNDPKLITRSELVFEYEQALKTVEDGLERIEFMAIKAEQDLDRQDAIKVKLVEVGSVLAEGGSINPTAVLPSLLALLGVGAVVDNRIKDRIIKTQKKST